jgi:hypothetical protein
VFLWCLIDGYVVLLKTEWYSKEKCQYTRHIRLMYGTCTGLIRLKYFIEYNNYYDN